MFKLSKQLQQHGFRVSTNELTQSEVSAGPRSSQSAQSASIERAGLLAVIIGIPVLFGLMVAVKAILNVAVPKRAAINPEGEGFEREPLNAQGNRKTDAKRTYAASSSDSGIMISNFSDQVVVSSGGAVAPEGVGFVEYEI